MKKRILFPLLFGSIALACGAVSVSTLQASKGYQSIDSWSEVNYNDAYSYQDTLDIQPRVFIKGGLEYTATATVTLPNGEKSEKTNITLDQIGNYSIDYSAFAEGKLYTKSVKFNVRYGAYYFNTNKSSASYGKTDNADTEGLVVDLAKDDTFHLTKHINFNNLSKSDILVKGYISPSVLGVADFNALTFKFTDSVDSSIFLQCSYFAYEISSQGGWSFAGAGGNDQEICGWLASKNQVYRGSGTGASMMTSFTGVRRNTLTTPSVYEELKDDAYPFQVSLDSKEMVVYGYNTTLICDLDSSVFFEKPWTGFPSGQADLTISASGYSGNNGTIVLTNVMGYDDLSDMSFEDTLGPKITMESEYDELPSGIIDMPYKVPSAKAFDDYSKDCNVTTEVIYNYASAKPSNVSLNNGEFTPKKCGPYAVRYTSTDKSNNKSYLLKTFNVYETLEPIDFDLPINPLTSCEVGDVVELDSPNNIKGGSGRKDYRVYATFGDRVVEIPDNKFIPDDIGEWVINYEVVDYLGQVQNKNYTVNVSMTNEYTLKGNPTFLAHYVSGCNYLMPEVNLFHKVDNKVQLVSGEVTLVDNNGETKVNSKSSFNPVITNNNDVITFKVIAGSQTLLVKEAKGIVPFTKEYDEDGLSYNKLSVVNYIDGTGYESFTNESLTPAGLQFKATSSNGEFEFANPLKNNNVSLSLYKISSKNSNAEIDVTVVDAYDNDKAVTIKAITSGINLNYVYGSEVMAAEYPFSNPDMNELSFSFDGTYVKLGGLVCKVNKFDNGLNYSGFENDVLVRVSFKSFNQNDSFILRTINNHTFNNDLTDKSSPIISLDEKHVIAHEFGETFRLPNASAFDVLSPNVDFKVTVVDANKEPVTSKDGVLLDKAEYKDGYEIELNQFGRFTITYSATESTSFMKKGNIANYEIYISIFDKIKPTITLTTDYLTEVTVGEYIVVPNYTVSDNYSDPENIHKIVSVTDPNGKTYYLDNTTEATRERDLDGNPIPAKNAFKVAQKGTHYVLIMVVDEAGNSATFFYEVIAKEAM